MPNMAPLRKTHAQHAGEVLVQRLRGSDADQPARLQSWLQGSHEMPVRCTNGRGRSRKDTFDSLACGTSAPPAGGALLFLRRAAVLPVWRA